VIPQLERISPKYLEMQKILHADPRGYGGRGAKWAGILLQVAIEYGATSILDYGCGQGSLAAALRQAQLGAIRIEEYDPAIPGKDGDPSFADLVNCTDVLEHIEPERLDAVLAHLRMLARKALFVVVSTKTSNKMLADGRNAHILVQSGWWWKQRFRKAGFKLRTAPTAARREVHKEWVVVLEP
jgi:2-polyprenyl-3-methyl-5-hydroxy-6-metoxy-1,4-benzoquinol methylase